MRLKLSFLCVGAFALLATPVTAATAWSLTQKSDPLTDQNVAVAMTSHTEGLATRSVFVRCTGNTLEVFIDFGEFLGSDLIAMRYRFDKKPLIEEKWNSSGDGTAVFADESRDFARQITAGRVLIAEAQDFQGQPHRASFDLGGADVSVGRVLSSCGISPVGLEQKTPGLRREIALELERWGPKNIAIKKKILKALGAYGGQLDSSMDTEFALAVQKFHDGYVSRCKDGSENGANCRELRVFWQSGSAHDVTASSIIYELSPGEFEDEDGELKSNE